MIFLTKLKAAAATAAVLLAVAGAFGPGPAPAAAGDDPAPAPRATARLADADAAFLDRVCVEFRGSRATGVEHVYFAADADADKRKKVTRWLLDSPATAAGAAKLEATYNPDGDRLLTLTTESNLAVTSEDVDIVLDKSVTALPARVRAPADAAWADLAKHLHAAQSKAEPGKRVEIVVQKDKDDKAVAPGEPVRVKVVVVTDDGTGGVKYKVEELPADAAKRVEVKGLQGYRLERVAPGKDGAPQAFFYRLVEDGKKADGKQPNVVRLWAAQPGGKDAPRALAVDVSRSMDTDAAFLRRAVTEARGTPPTALEERYFAADPDPKKREKLLDALLADPTALRRVGDGWKRRMLAPVAAPQPQVVPFAPKGDLFEFRLRDSDPKVPPKVEPIPPATTLPKADVQPFRYVQPKTQSRDLLVPKAATPPAPPAPPKAVAPPVPAPPAAAPLYRTVTRSADRWARLVDELIAAGKSDEQMLEALSLAAAGRLPTDVERRLALAALPTGADRATGWRAVARALAGPTPSAPPVPPTPAAPPLPPSSR